MPLKSNCSDAMEKRKKKSISKSSVSKRKKVSFAAEVTRSHLVTSGAALQKSSKAKELEKNSSTGQQLRTGKKLAEKLTVLSRKDRKIYLRKMKASKRPNYELLMNAKILWEKLRSKKISAEEKTRLSDQLYGMVEGKAKQLIFAHDTVRVLQCLMALKNAEIRTKLFDELKDDIVELSRMKYSKFFVIKMLKYGTSAQRNHIVKSFYGRVVDLMRNSVACDVVEYAFNEYADALKRSRICTEFYSKELQLFKVEEAVSLQQILLKQPEKKSFIQKYLLENILAISAKVALRHSLMHRVCLEFIQCFPDQKSDFVDVVKERIPEILHTKDGALVAMHCVWYGNAKDRKLVVKSLKGLVLKVCQEEYGHAVLMAIFDSVDDTVSVSKIILAEIKENLKIILANKFGVRVVLYLLNPRDKRHFNSKMVETLSLGDNNEISKKPAQQRTTELLDEIYPHLVEYAAQNAREMILESTNFPLLFSSICQYAAGDKSAIYAALCELVAEEFIPCNVEMVHLIEHSRGHYIFSHLLKNDVILARNGLRKSSWTLFNL